MLAKEAPKHCYRLPARKAPRPAPDQGHLKKVLLLGHRRRAFHFLHSNCLWGRRRQLLGTAQQPQHQEARLGPAG